MEDYGSRINVLGGEMDGGARDFHPVFKGSLLWLEAWK